MSGRKTETTEMELTPAAAPRKRGRPRKVPVAETAETKPAVTEQPKRRQSRTAQNTEETKSVKKPAVTKSDTDSETVSAPKKRGRPRKVPEAEAEKTNAPTSEQKPEATQNTQKKTRKSTTKQAKPQDATIGDISSKTPQVMRLVQQGNDMVNPTIMAGKSSIPRKLRGLEPLTKIMKREAEEIFGTDQEDETFNLTALVIDDNAAEILRRFNACDCEICVEQLSRLTADIVPARFAKLKRRAVERNTPEVEELKAPLRRSVTSQMIRLVIQNKKRSYHD